MWRAEIMIGWNVALRRAQLLVDFPQIDGSDGGGYTDVTGQDAANIEPEPNLYNVVAEMSLSTLTAIEADANYNVLWSEEIIDE